MNTERAERVFICVGKDLWNDQARAVARWAALQGYNPIVTAAYYEHFLYSFSDKELSVGQTLGKELVGICDWIWVFPCKDYPLISADMRKEIELAEKYGIKKYFWTPKKIEGIEYWLETYDLMMRLDHILKTPNKK
ncbi:MAG: hypothetical protein A3H69_05910 [Candidatus Sungbacteria bacterium RIFCSPLOWO2_02_FULL_47_9]|uniref:DUF7768 domain-containing protein n=1 Tax=Candidatus Sungbacteria bacterium RIFCSPHIGHO2_01_FULL_47_32 TaxID=1802264 RepID=A0A1G2K6U3_9BACT|nr:MAG: hypothetical protein UX72_C0013G0014 [Parcubacteria group bacterium GW2011_GWA2_47_10]OGZ94923.1 MAG: hypothetical protein A2633_03210 [Candidatus Sungbacteria bacterium RIFCSPHIGHO2_01_FULL_47_32]OGZ99980.1 MAG: hypothetical protein A3D57_04525 [Candidatus Sungbacteria bacterium RIFCSPHIGHO2_02_FULL_46_12]OHA04495.1 MAG: hypothetical protein A3A28_04055 [Candidatus Sungbacteria bacterium RIFCSPLOWO2_01_FULL_47_32]OHA10947.1 MAG: hypothetical protein A3H69_05910 [Candidatus Sungbacteria